MWQRRVAWLALCATAAGFDCILDPAIPEWLVEHRNVQPLCAGYLDPTAPPFNAAGDGVADDTASINAALAAAYLNRMAVRLPASRTYAVSGQLKAVQEGRPQEMREYGFQLIGQVPIASSNESPPKIKLQDGAVVENNTLFMFQLMVDGAADPASHYASAIRGVSIDMGNNPTVSAISMSGAQLCSIEDVTITGSAFLAGIVGLPGSGGFSSNVKIVGGQIGIWQQQYRPNPLATAVVLINQTCCPGCCRGPAPLSSPSAVLVTQARGPLVIAGFSITGGGARYAALRLASTDSLLRSPSVIEADNSLALEDGIISIAGEAGVAIENLGDAKRVPRDISIEQVWIRGGTAVRCGNVTIASTAGGAWGLLRQWSYTASGSLVYAGHNETRDYGFEIDVPKLSRTPSASTPPSILKLLSAHTWDPLAMPAWDNESVIDIVRDAGCTPDWVNGTDDDGPRIEAAAAKAAAAGKALFIPRGLFHTHRTISLTDNVRVIGAGRHVATISSLATAWIASGSTENFSMPVIAVIGSDVILSDVAIRAETPGRTSDPGSNSGVAHATMPVLSIMSPSVLVRDTRTYRLIVNAPPVPYMPLNVPAVAITGKGGGKFFGFALDWLKTPPAQPSVVGTALTINGTANPVHLYSASVEHLTGSHFQVELFRASNVRFYSFKFESFPVGVFESQRATGGLLAAHSCQNVSIFGGSGNYGLMNMSLAREIIFAWGTPGLRLAALVRKPQNGEHSDGAWIRDVHSSGAVTSLPVATPSLLLYQGG